MNVLHLISNKVWGGGERYALDLCRRLVEDDHSVAVISRGIEAVDAPFKAAGIPTAKLPLRGAFDLVSPIALAKVLNRMAAPIVVHVHNFKDASTALRARRLMRDPAKVRIVCTRHLVKAAKTSRSAQRIFAELDAIIFVSQTARDAFMSTHPEIDESKIRVVHNAIHLHADAPAQRPDKKEEITLAFIGRISPEKGLDVLIRAMRKLTDLPLRLLIAGTGKGSDVMPLVRMTRSPELKDRVEWLGHVDNTIGVIDCADIGVLPSVCTEAFGLVVLEFMSRGVPVIATAHGGPKEIITDGADGMLVAPSDADALAAAIRRLATDDSLRHRLSETAARTFDRCFDYDDFYWKILKIYEQ